ATGFYDDELDKQIKEKADYLKKEKKRDIVNLFIISIVFTIIFLIISIYLAKILEKYLIRYRREVLRHINKNREKDSMLAQQSKMAAMGEMIENIAHQWRQPLNLISISSTGMKLKKEHDILSNEEFNEGMDQITRSSNYLSQTIDDFREFFSPNKKKILFNIKDTFEKTFELLDAQLLAKDIILIKDIDEVEIFSYENELIQVIINLINNSKDELVKYENIKRMIFISAKANSRTVTINIKDNAGGIDESIINRIFEPYFTTKHKSQGTGIGLYMSREIIVKHMKGKLEVSNSKYIYQNISYKGASFDIKLSLKKLD
ncbi:sensor histidine kinase, partial [Poseidonibacter sp.]|uniref:sensor histidine kinase n=1 Tax=Poseidonibacter sp. TaxID=2321188 RepID=UPI003C74A595